MEYCVEFFVCRSAIKHVNTKNSVNDKLIMVSYFSSILSSPSSGSFVSE